MNQPRVYMCSPSWTPLPPPSPSYPSGSSQCTSPEHPVPCIEPGLAIYFTYDNIHVSMLFSQIIPPSPSPTESKSLFFISVSLLLSCIQGLCYHLSKLHVLCCANLLLSCLTLCDPMDCSPPGFSVHGILQARILEWIAMPSSRGSPPPRDRTHISYSGRWILYPLSHLGNPSHWYLICIYSALTGGSTTLEALQSITVTPLLFPIVSAITKGHSKFKSKLCLSMSFWLG